MKLEDFKDYDINSLTKDKLVKDSKLAVSLAKWNDEFGKHPLAQDLGILSLEDGQVAEGLASNSDRNGWALTPAAQKMEVLELHDGWVARWLAEYSSKSGWGWSAAAYNYDVLSLRDGEIAKVFVWCCPEWVKSSITQYMDILKLSDGEVAGELALYSKKNGWGETPAAHDLEVLKLNKGRVKKWLVDRFPENGWESMKKGKNLAIISPVAYSVDSSKLRKSSFNKEDKKLIGLN